MSKPKKETKTVKAALHDKDGVFLRIDEVLESELTEFHNPAITECDLPSNAYRWDGKTYIPIKKVRRNFSADAETAMAMGFLALHEQGIELPQETLKWSQRYMRKFDEIKNLDKGV